MHQSEWERLTTDEKLEHVRLHQVAQDGLILAVIQAVERLGVTFTLGKEADDPDGEDARPFRGRLPRRELRGTPLPNPVRALATNTCRFAGRMTSLAGRTGAHRATWLFPSLLAGDRGSRRSDTRY